MTRRFAFFLGMALLLAAGVAAAEERFPPPDFTDHQLPATSVPDGRLPVWEYVDLAVLTAGLSLAALFALVVRRRWGLFALAIVSLAWLGFWREGCVCPIGAIQNVTAAVFDRSYVLPWTVAAFFALPLLFALFFGRAFCAAVCPLGAVQELVLVRPVKVPTWLEHALGILPYVYLGLAVVFAATGSAFVICRYDPFVGFFRLSGGVNMLILGGCFLVAGMFVGRPYCRFLCPYGALLGLLSRVSQWHLKIPPQECISCRLCEDVCPYGAIREPTVDQGPDQRRRGRWLLGAMILLLPCLTALGAWLGTNLEAPMAKLHPTVRLAERIRLEETGKVEGTTDASDAFRNTGMPSGELYRAAVDKAGQFRLAGGLFGAWVGLVIGAKLIHLSVRRRRTDYQPDRANCVSCGRCFWYCPNEQSRRGWIEGMDQAEKET